MCHAPADGVDALLEPAAASPLAPGKIRLDVLRRLSHRIGDACGHEHVGEQARHPVVVTLAELGHVQHRPRNQPARFRHHYLGGEDDIPLFDGVEAGIRNLNVSGFQLAVATGKNRAGLQRAFESSGLGDAFLATRTADQTHSKPHPAMVLEIIEELGADPARTLVIGDTGHDLLMASNAGVASLGVTYGAHEIEDLLPHSPLALIDSFHEVHAWLNANA